MKPDNIVLEGIVGSKAYGLDTEHSDTDVKGIYVVPTDQALSLTWTSAHTTKVHTDPDWAYHEVQQFLNLAKDCNPTIIELLFLEDYTQLTEVGKLLVNNRSLFLSQMARKRYGGYAKSQAKQLATNKGRYGNGRGNRFEKHTRHCFRLLYQGQELLETGNVTVRVTPEVREELFAIGKLTPSEVITLFEKRFKEFDTYESILPEKPDYEAINELLLAIRKRDYETN